MESKYPVDLTQWKDLRGHPITSNSEYNIRRRENYRYKYRKGKPPTVFQAMLCQCGKCKKCRKRIASKKHYRRKALAKRYELKPKRNGG